MLRRTAARAFGAREGSSAAAPLPPGGPSVHRDLAVERLFEELLRCLESLAGPEDPAGRLRSAETGDEMADENGDEIAEESGGGGEATGRGSGGTIGSGKRGSGTRGDGAVSGAAEEDALSISKPRPRLEGIEFVLEGPGGAVRCIHTLRGFLRVRWESGGDLLLEDLLSVERQGGAYRPIRKRFPLARSSFEAPAGRRAGFLYTTVPELAASYRRLAAGR